MTRQIETKKGDVVTLSDGCEYHVTSTRNGGVYGHATAHCDESGCAGDELYLGPAAELWRAEDHELWLECLELEGRGRAGP